MSTTIHHRTPCVPEAGRRCRPVTSETSTVRTRLRRRWSRNRAAARERDDELAPSVLALIAAGRGRLVGRPDGRLDPPSRRVLDDTGVPGVHR